MGEPVTNQDILGLVESLDKLGGKNPKRNGEVGKQGFPNSNELRITRGLVKHKRLRP